MDISKIIAKMRTERARIDEAIVSLERLSLMGTPRRGRPPAWSRVTNLCALQGRKGQNGSMKGVAQG